LASRTRRCANGQKSSDETQIRRRTPRLGDKWQLDEVVVTIKGKRHFLWRAVDQDGIVLEVLVQKTPRYESCRPEQLEIERLRKEVAKLKAERDILKGPPPTLRRT
jgi:hypothetical protein